MNGRRALALGICVCAGLAARARPAGAETPEVTLPNPVLVAPLAHMLAIPSAPPVHVVPSHLEIGNRIFDGSVSGLRAYLESIKATEPQLYAQLAPDVEHLEAKQSAAIALGVIGLSAATAATMYALADRSDCQQPSIYDPHFADKIAAWGACTDHNLTVTAEFAFIALGAAMAGGIGAAIVAPHRADLLEVVDKHNRSSPQPLRLLIGYDPGRRLAGAGVALTF